MGILIGDEAFRVEGADDEALKDEIQEVFSNAFQRSKLTWEEFRPIQILKTTWSRQELFLGSFTYQPVGAFKDCTKEDLKRSLPASGPCTLHFAGDGIDDLFSGYLHGAYRSGLYVAEKILEDL